MTALLAAIEPLSNDLQAVSIADKFLTKLNMCRDDINRNLQCKHINFNLQNQLDQIEKRYTLSKQYENEIKNIKPRIYEIKCHLEVMGFESVLNVFSRRLIAQLTKALCDEETKMYNLRAKFEIFDNIEIVFDTTNNNNKLNDQTGRVILTQDWDYSQYSHRVICNDVQYLSDPRGVAIDNNDNIYIANYYTSTVSVISMTGECLRQIGKGTLSAPWGITVHNDSLYITCKHSLYKYTLAGDLVKTVTYYGSYNNQPNNGRGVHLNTNKGLLFVCDSFNNCIPVFNENLEYQRTISHEYIKQPRDISTKHEQIYILTKYVLHVLSEEGTYLKRIANKFTDAIFFTLDSYNNIIISDSYSINILILALYNNNNIKFRLGNSLFSHGIALSINNFIVNAYDFELQLYSL